MCARECIKLMRCVPSKHVCVCVCLSVRHCAYACPGELLLMHVSVVFSHVCQCAFVHALPSPCSHGRSISADGLNNAQTKTRPGPTTTAAVSVSLAWRHRKAHIWRCTEASVSPTQCTPHSAMHYSPPIRSFVIFHSSLSTDKIKHCLCPW